MTFESYRPRLQPVSLLSCVILNSFLKLLFFHLSNGAIDNINPTTWNKFLHKLVPLHTALFQKRENMSIYLSIYLSVCLFFCLFVLLWKVPSLIVWMLKYGRVHHNFLERFQLTLHLLPPLVVSKNMSFVIIKGFLVQ